MKTQATDREVTVTLHRSDFDELTWEKFKHSTYWYDTIFAGKNIIRILTWESNYESVCEMYNFNN